MSGPRLIDLPTLRRRTDAERFDGERQHSPVEGCAGRCRTEPCVPVLASAMWPATAKAYSESICGPEGQRITHLRSDVR